MTDSSTSATMQAAKTAIAEKDWEAARRLLAPMVIENPRGVGAFMLARAELGAGHPEAAGPLVAAFRAWRPQHVGARMLSARVHLANKELDSAETEALAVQEMEPERAGLSGLFALITAAQEAENVERHIRLIDQHYRAARHDRPSTALLEAAAALSRMSPAPNWTGDVSQAKVAYFHHADDLQWALRNYDPELIAISCQFDYATWPRRIQEYVQGRSVLDVGCGFGGFGMGFLIAGASSYAGLDPAMELDSTRAKNKRSRTWADMGVTPRAIANALPAIRLIQSSSEDNSFNETFDTIALHNVTEHLLQLDDVLGGLVRLCHPQTDIVLHHHNYFCWNGHHLQPSQPRFLDEGNPKHQEIYDWRHVDALPALPEDHYISTHLNRVRLDDFRSITERHFDIVRWDEIPSNTATLERLSPCVLDRVRKVIPDLTERDLAVNTVFAVARPRASAGNHDSTPLGRSTKRT